MPGHVRTVEGHGETTVVVEAAELVEAANYARDELGFSFLSDVSPKVPPNYDVPTTRKAIATFANLSEIKLVEFVYEKKKKLLLRPS